MDSKAKPKRKIGFIQAFFMIVVAVIFDSSQWFIELISFGMLGWFLNPIVSIFASMTFFMWFTLSGVSFIKPGKMLVMTTTTLIEVIPWINDVPAWTLGVIITLAMVYAEDIVALISPEAAAALAVALAKINGKGLSKGTPKGTGVVTNVTPKPALVNKSIT